MRTITILAITIIGAGIGLLGDVMTWQGMPRAPILGITGLLIGLLLGWIITGSMPRSARTQTPRNHQSQRMTTYRDRGLQRMANYRRG